MAPFANLRFHDLRHHAITVLSESDASEETVMQISGHVSKEMKHHYSHIRDAAKRKAIEGITSWVPPEDDEPVPATKLVQ
jgi:integrase